MIPARAFTYITDDPAWTEKIVITAVLSVVAVVTLPFLGLGLLPFCILLGYMLQVVDNVRQKKARPLPKWENYGDLLASGARVLPPLIVYNLPFLLFGGFLLFIQGVFPDEAISGFATLTTLCCVLPLSLLYLAFSWPMLAAGTVRYARDGNAGIYWQIGRLWELSSEIRAYSIQWVLIVAGLNLLTVIGLFIPIVGWLAIAALGIPVQAHLLGQYGQRMDDYRQNRLAKLRR